MKNYLQIVIVVVLMISIDFPDNVIGQAKGELLLISQQKKVLFSNVIFDTLNVENLKSLVEEIKETDFVETRVYLTGPGYPQVTSIPIDSKAKLISRIVLDFKSGNRIVFENSVIRKKDGSLLKPFNKSIYIR